jgi:Peptidase_C39 like family
LIPLAFSGIIGINLYLETMPTTFKATANTWVKLAPTDSTLLSEKERVFARKDTLLKAEFEGLIVESHYAIVDTDHNLQYLFINHWGIVDSDLPENLHAIASNEAIQRQIDRLNAYMPKGATANLGLYVNFFSQRDNFTQPHRTCNSSSNAMYLDWLCRVTGKKGITDDEYLRKVIGNGDTTIHHVQTETIGEFGFKTKWNTDADIDFVEDLVASGFPVVVNILHRGSQEAPRGGHIIVLIGNKAGSWIAHDPYGTLASDYKNPDGKFAKIGEKEFLARWQGGYRILA